MIMAEPTGLEIHWKRGVFQVYCCNKAFDPKENCKLMICVDCHNGNNVNTGAAKIIERGKRMRRNTGTSVAKLTGAPTETDCEHHTWADLKKLRLETDALYCVRNRKKGERVQKHCTNMLTVWHYCVRNETIDKLGLVIVM